MEGTVRGSTGEADSIVSIAFVCGVVGQENENTKISPHLPKCHLSDNRQSFPNPRGAPAPAAENNWRVPASVLG